MRRLGAALTVSMALTVPLLPVVAPAGGRAHSRHGLPARVGSSAHGAFKAIPEFRPKGAFGSPGGFPFPDWSDHHGRRRASRHAFFSPSLAPAFLYTPGALYGSSIDPAPPTVIVSPVIHAAPTVYVYQPSTASGASPVSAPPLAESPLPRVVEHPTGRYELRGDGGESPYVWVWIPHPPPVPPAASPSSPAEPPAGQARPAPPSATYQWTDEEGTTFMTNRLEKVPHRYRSRVQGAAEVIR
jgi:hypothetical protein